jgi:hypothetical protein
MANRLSDLLTSSERRIVGLFRLAGMLAEMDSSLKNVGIKVKVADGAFLRSMLSLDDEEEDIETIQERLKSSTHALNGGQRSFFGVITKDLAKKDGQLHYLDGPGGTGKTFLLNTILDWAAVAEIKAVVTASSGVAALLLRHGQTTHSAFQIPIDVGKNAKCTFDVNSPAFDHLQRARLIVWDKVVMIHKNTIEAVDRSLQALCCHEVSACYYDRANLTKVT